MLMRMIRTRAPMRTLKLKGVHAEAARNQLEPDAMRAPYDALAAKLQLDMLKFSIAFMCVFVMSHQRQTHPRRAEH